MPANSYFFPLFEQVGNEAFLLNFGISKTKQKFITIAIKHKEKSSQVTSKSRLQKFTTIDIKHKEKSLQVTSKSILAKKSNLGAYWE